MNEDPVVKIEHVSKKFCRSLKRSLWYGMQDLAGELIARNGANELRLRPQEFLAVDDVSLELRRGECLGLIGPNGAGKSTLLKMLNGLIRPDAGSITIHGRVGALIELGAGFNPILSGRDNIYVNGAVLGFSKKEIDRKFDVIVDFAELGESIDSPVYSYSSGMHVRLGFAIAANLYPDVLLVDEVLAVGDSAYRLKCMRSIREKVDSGMGIILVSHQMRNIMNICSRTIWLHQGRFREEGSSNEICLNYEKFMISSATGEGLALNATFSTPNGGVRFVQVAADGQEADNCFEFSQDVPVEICLTIESERYFDSLFFNYLLRTVDDVMIFGAREPLTPACADPNRYTIRWRLPAGILMPGTYRLETALAYEYRWGTNIQELRPACHFTVTGKSKMAGICNLPVTIVTQIVDNPRI